MITFSILVGVGIIAFSIALTSAMIVVCIDLLDHIDKGRIRVIGSFSKTVVLTAITCWLVTGFLFVSLIWAWLYLYLGDFQEFEPAFYFSLISITTVGYGDIILTSDTRLLAGFQAADGFILFGLDTAFLFEVVRRLRG
ncbi:MAG: ion channel [Pseudomonadota bacterium]